MKTKSQLVTAACCAAFVFCGPSLAFAASKKSDSASPSPAASASPSSKASSTEKAPRATPFRGTATAVDKSAKSFTIAGKKESRVFKVTDKTTVTKKDGSAATFADLNDNTAVTGSYWKQADGSLETKSLKIGDAVAEKSSAKKSDAAAGGASPSPSPKK